MKTKKFFALLLALAMLLALAACGNAPADTNETNTNTGAKRKLVVANWQSYATDSDYGAAHFAELYDCEVEHYFLSSIPELLSVLENGGVGQIDVVCINPLYLQQYLNAGVLDTIDTSALENYNRTSARSTKSRTKTAISSASPGFGARPLSSTTRMSSPTRSQAGPLSGIPSMPVRSPLKTSMTPRSVRPPCTPARIPAIRIPTPCAPL